MPTKRQLSKMREAELEYPQIRRKDDPMKNTSTTKKQSHTGFRNGDLFCYNCGTAYKVNLPQPVDMFTAIMKQFDKSHKNCEKTWVEPVPDSNGKTLEENKSWWLLNGEHGISSKNMFAVLSGGYTKSDRHLSSPSDPDDFKRCSQLLEAVPQWRSELHKLKPISETWSNLVDNWDKLETMLIEARELWSKNQGAKEMYDFMKNLGC
jgi:hypothetical protein